MLGRAAAIPLTALAIAGCNADKATGPRDAAPPSPPPAAVFAAPADEAAGLAAALADAAERVLPAAVPDRVLSGTLAARLRALDAAVQARDGATVLAAAAAARQALARAREGEGVSAADLDAMTLALDRVRTAVRIEPTGAQ
jgi:hypothetical protein